MSIMKIVFLFADTGTEITEFLFERGMVTTDEKQHQWAQMMGEYIKASRSSTESSCPSNFVRSADRRVISYADGP